MRMRLTEAISIHSIKFGGEIDVAVGDPAGQDTYQRQRRQRGRRPMEKLLREHACEVQPSANCGSAAGYVGKSSPQAAVAPRTGGKVFAV